MHNGQDGINVRLAHEFGLWARPGVSMAAQILVSQHGADTHRLDPLAHLEISINAQRAAHAAIHALAHDHARGRWLLTGGGGYDLVHVVPRTWTHLRGARAWLPLST